MATDGEKLQSTSAVVALCCPPGAALKQNAGEHGKGFNIVNQRGFAKQPMGAWERGLVARLRAFIFQGFE
jgi:hypothetical protein